MKISIRSGKENLEKMNTNPYKDKKFLIIEKTVSPGIRGANKKNFGGVG